MDNTGRAWPYGTSEQNDPNADVYPWVASLTGIGGTTDDYMRQYRAQQQGLERQLGGLSLGGTTADPDSGAIRRTSVSGSMRMPRQPSLRDSQISSARHSIDTSYAGSSHSRSRHSAASSEAYSSFSEEPAIAPQRKKSGGLKSLLKIVKKAFVPSSGKKSSKDGMHQPEVVEEITYRADYVKRGRPSAEVHTIIPEDQAIITDFIDNAPGLGIRTVQQHANRLRSFSAWLQTQPEGRTLAGLLDDPDDPHGLTGRANAFADETGVIVNTTLAALQRVRARSGASADDEHLFSQLTKAMNEARETDPSIAQPGTVRNWVAALRKFSVWLQEQPRNLTVASLVDDPGALNARAEQFATEGGAGRVIVDLTVAVEALLDWRAGIDPSHRTPRLVPCADDAHLINGLLNQELAIGPESKKRRFQNTASSRRGFSDWLRRKGAASIASRVNGNQEQRKELEDDFQIYKTAMAEAGKRIGGVSLNDLRKYQQVVEANAALGMPPLQPPQQSGQSPVSGYDQALLRDGQGGASPMPSPSEGAWELFTGYVHGSAPPAGWEVSSSQGPPATPDTPSEGGASEWMRGASEWRRENSEWMREQMQGSAPPARARSSHIYSGLSSLVDLPSTPHELRDDAHSAPAWAAPPSFASPSTPKPPELGGQFGRGNHSSKRASPTVINILDAHGVLPSQFAPQTRFLIREQLYTAELRSNGSVRITHHPGAWLGDTDWLYDPHITRDYGLLERELQETDPDLAARTRFVDSSVALSLRTDEGQRHHLEPILRGPEDFLFLPVNNADPADPSSVGTHWSLLLFDRRDRENQVAYHYDSLGGYNNPSAAALATTLGATTLVPASMTRQDNGYDCGVFVVDATRALVDRLAQGLRQREHLNNLNDLVADRRALQERLRPP